MKKLKIALGIILYFVLAFSLAFSLVNCSGAKKVPACMAYQGSFKPEHPKKISKFKGKAPMHYKHHK